LHKERVGQRLHHQRNLNDLSGGVGNGLNVGNALIRFWGGSTGKQQNGNQRYYEQTKSEHQRHNQFPFLLLEQTEAHAFFCEKTKNSPWVENWQAKKAGNVALRQTFPTTYELRQQHSYTQIYARTCC